MSSKTPNLDRSAGPSSERRWTLREFLGAMRHPHVAIPREGTGVRSWLPGRYSFATSFKLKEVRSK